VESQKIPETKPVEKGNILPADMPAEPHKPSQGYGKKHGKDRVKAEQQDTHVTPLVKTVYYPEKERYGANKMMKKLAIRKNL
jgi:hypothetical protein